ncbi:uncharacterized protein LOC106154670 [Lingula anatina]|uniref:Uncharacterized protein LOC106154670 n=1 Tax=Lingula anatina TaxID=7574 RepID=A0A1S3HEQ7_LINAN|nr:uncharacterized protein LOC106154670 [Lingula anatina]|eukprot:XP_013384548.1 uncharacterized protein LOC106154670 [Lingula anatina]
MADTPEGHKYEEGTSSWVTESIKKEFDDNGFIIVRNLLSSEELKRVKDALETDGRILQYRLGRDDGKGRRVNMTLWNHPGEDITGMVARSEKVVNAMETFLDGEVYHYHTKLIQKDAHTGGSFVWHQDYGYWYHNGCLFPDMATVFIAIDRADRNNGCLQILPGSHKLGRIDHVPIGNQTGADLERVKQASKVLPLTYVELNPGDAAFFHCNLLHTSDQNNSDRRRWGLVCCYNSARNNPVIAHHHPQYTPLKKVPNKAILECPLMADKSEETKWFYKETDSSPQGLAVKASR